MRIIKSFFIAFSMYSKIPMPPFEWKDEDMRYALCFFPLGGSGGRCPVVSVEMDLCPVRSGNLVLYGGGNGDTDSDHRGLSCGWIFRYL